MKYKALFEAAKEGDISKIQNLSAKEGFNINERDEDGNTALHIATASFKLDTVRCLLNYGADPKLQNNDGNTPLQKVSNLMFLKDMKSQGETDAGYNKEEIFEIIDLLRQSSGQVYPEAGIPVSDINFDTLDKYLKIYVNSLGKDGWTHLQRAITQKKIEEIKQLLQRKDTDLFTPSKYGYKALDIAIFIDDPKILELLLQKINPNDPKCVDSDNNTPLHLAAKFLRPTSIEMLLAKGADTQALNINEQKPVDIVTNTIEGFIELTKWWKEGPLREVSLSAFGFPDREHINDMIKAQEGKVTSSVHTPLIDSVENQDLETIGKTTEI